MRIAGMRIETSWLSVPVNADAYLSMFYRFSGIETTEKLPKHIRKERLYSPAGAAGDATTSF
jgi:hypothetical protein